MLKDFLGKKSQATFVEYGYGQVEPNHLSAQRTGQIYAQLPAKKDIAVLEQGQFVKYDYANGMVDFDGPGEWMLVYNETKLYREHQNDCEFALIADDYQARIYSPFGYGLDANGVPVVGESFDRQSRYYNGEDAAGKTFVEVPQTFSIAAEQASIEIGGRVYTIDGGYIKDYPTTGNDVQIDTENGISTATVNVKYAYDDVTAGADPYEPHYNTDPMHIAGPYREQRMADTVNSMVPRVLKTNVGDIYTTNTIKEDADNIKVGATLVPNKNNYGILEYKSNVTDEPMVWQVVKMYTMPDHQRAVKLMRIK